MTAPTVFKQAVYWIERRTGPTRLESDTSMMALEDVRLESFPYIVLTSVSLSALGELFCVCRSKRIAEAIAKAMNETKFPGEMDL